uniref:Uncharacterized protein n=1 Tax=Arundo donax TaxID=35708 RepID=A0A0A9A5K8_ARUDO
MLPCDNKVKTHDKELKYLQDNFWKQLYTCRHYYSQNQNNFICIIYSVILN